MPSKRSVNSISAASPRRRTASTIPATAAWTSSAISRLPSRNRPKAASKPLSPASSLSGIGDLPDAVDPPTDLARAGLQRRPVDDQPARNIGELRDLAEPALLQRAARRHGIADAPRSEERRGGNEVESAVVLGGPTDYSKKKKK